MCAVFARRILRHFKSHMKMNFTDTPIVVVLGSTGAGKSKLALEIAEEFDGEIISADSMQVYKGLDIISNKVTPEEQEQVPHHMIDIVEPTTDYSVVKFRDACLSLIEELHGRRKLPVVVGGTNYYIEAVLWKVLVADQPADGSDADAQGPADSADGSAVNSPVNSPGNSPVNSLVNSPGNSPVNSAVHSAVNSAVNSADKTEDSSADDTADVGSGCDSSRHQLERLSTEQLYARLRERDPAQAQVLHPNERRKIIRSLEVTLRSGRPMSEHLRLQRAEAGGGALGGPLRFPRTCLLWVTAEQDTLDGRLDGRVDTMLQRGLLAELADFHRSYNAARLRDGVPADYTRGIFQSIGFKEFHGYLTRPATADAGETERLLAEGVDRLKLVTRRYARKQTRWVRRRFLSAGSRQVPPLYRLDATDPSQWEERVRRPAAGVVRAWLEGRTPQLASEELLSTTAGDKTTHHCPVCDVYTSGAQQRDEHLRSRRHQRTLKGRKRRQEREEVTDVKRAAVGGDGVKGKGREEERMAAEHGGTDGEASGETKEHQRDEEELAKTTLPKGETVVKDSVQGAA